MAAFYDNTGALHQVNNLTADVYAAAEAANLTVAQYINREYGNADQKLGTAFAQMCASEGLALPGKNPLGIRTATVAEVLDGRSGISASNSKDQGSPFGSSSRILFPAAIVQMVEDKIVKDYDTDTVVFNDMVAMDVSIGSENFIQPVISYGTLNGPEGAKAQRVSQLAEPPSMLRFTTSERNRSIPTYSIGLEFSQQALRATTLDLVALTLQRFLMVEKDGRVYQYLSSMFAGDSDLNTGAVTAVTSNSLDASATGGVMTHKAWVKFLARNRKKRKITHVIGDINAYLAVEGRTGRPGTVAYDPRLAVIDPQASVVNQGFGNDVKWFITDLAASEGGPVPANTVWALDATKAIARVSNSSANSVASQEFALRKSEALRMDWSEDVYRVFGNTDLTPFDVLTIS